MRKFNQDAPGVKLRGRPKKESSDKRDRKVSVNFTDAEEREVKAKAAAAGVSIAELLRISAFRLSIVGRLTDFEREAIRELMYQGKNLNAQVKLKNTLKLSSKNIASFRTSSSSPISTASTMTILSL